MGLGLLDMVGLAAALALAVPVAHFGLMRVGAGEPVGWAFVGVGVLIVAVEQYLTTPGDVPGMIAERVTGRVVEDEED
jgi:hypothetical protein